MASGLKYNLKSAEGEKKRAVYANMEKLFTSFEEAGRQLQQQNEKNAVRQEAMETKVIPSVVGYLTYLQNSPSYDEAFNNLNSRVEQLKTVMGEQMDGELVALSPRNYEVGIFKDRKTGKLIEMPVSSLLPPDLLKGRPDLNTYERAQDAQKLSIDRQNAASNQQRAEASLLKAQSAQKPSAEEEETRTLLELHRLLTNPNIDPTSGAGTGIKKWFAQNIPLADGITGKGLAEQQAYSQATADLKGQAFKKHGYRNQAEFENIHTLPNTLPRAEALKVVEAELHKRGIDPSKAGGGGQAVGSPEAIRDGAAGNGGQVKIQDPSTGQVGLLSPEQARIAISRGGIPVDGYF
jgi:hypothetical protein